MNKSPVPLTLQSLILLITLLLLGYLGNYTSLPLFFGVDFILGSIAVLIVLYFYGVVLGVLAAVIASSYTYWLWGHPYAVIIFSLEALFVGLCLRRGYRSLLLLDGFYWLVIGMPLIWVCYGLVMGMDGLSTLLIMLKQSINGIFNALLASLAIHHLPLARTLEPGAEHRTTDLRETLFTILVALILGPALTLMILNSRGDLQVMQDDTLKEMHQCSNDVTSQLSAWYHRNFATMTQLAAVAEVTPMAPSPALQHDVEIIHNAVPDFRIMYVGNAQGIAIAASPAVNGDGKRLIGTSFADRPYFKEMQTTRQPILSEVFIGRVTFSPVVSLSIPIFKGEEFRGYVTGGLELRHIQNLLESYGKGRQLYLTLVDDQGRVVVSTDSAKPPLSPWGARPETLKLVAGSVYHWLPGDENQPRMLRWKKSLYVLDRPIAALGWKLVVEAPVAPLQQRLYLSYVHSLAVMAGLVILILIIAEIFSRWLVRPLAGLVLATGNLPEKLAADQEIPWPASSATEIHSLVSNFQGMARTLKTYIQELKAGSAQLAAVNAGLEEQIAERLRAEAALRQSEERYRLLAENSRDVIWRLDANRHLTYISPAVEVLTGFTVAESLQKGWGQILTPASWQTLQEKIAQLQEIARRDQPAIPPAATLELEHCHKDGGAVWTEVHATLLRDPQGHFTGIMGVTRDISLRRRVQEELRESEQRFRDISENTAEWIWEVDAAGKFTYSNPMAEQLVGYKPDEILALHFFDLFYPEDAAALHQKAFAINATKRPFRDFSHRALNKQGEMLWLSASGVPVLSDQGDLRGYRGSTVDITVRQRWEESLKEANQKLQLLVTDAEERNRQMALLNEMRYILQSCQTTGETFAVIAHYVPKFFPADAGAVYIADAAAPLLTVVTSWGQPAPAAASFPPDDCWAVRSGRLYLVGQDLSGPPCKHVDGATPVNHYLCIPLMAQGKSQGILHVRFQDSASPAVVGDVREAKVRLAVAIAENLALGLANVKLRETLHNQAIRDPLTGLHNRRYLEETLARELHDPQSQKAPLGIVMLDLDNFKQFNQTFGPGAGDALLNALATLVKDNIREADVACRYGGEEFLIFMPETPLATARQLAETLRRAVKELRLAYQGRVLPCPSISLGVAAYPDHGATAEEVIAAAHAALHGAKQSGRDRTEVAAASPPGTTAL